MKKVIRGKAFVYGANIDTDQIYPGRFLELTDPQAIAKHAMAGVDPNFVKAFRAGDIIVASTNFGCGSSREQAVITLKALGVGAILADSFGRIFYRNAINLGLSLLLCPGISKIARKGDILVAELISGRITNETTGAAAEAQPLSDYVMKILESGGIKPLIRRQLSEAGR